MPNNLIDTYNGGSRHELIVEPFDFFGSTF